MTRRDHIAGSFSFSYTTYAAAHDPAEEPRASDESIPLPAFAHASTMQAVARYLVDVRGISFSDAARLLGRSVKTVWTSYHQAGALPALTEGIPIPISIFRTTRAPLEALVLYLKRAGMRNADIARNLHLDPRTTWTAAKRGEARP